MVSLLVAITAICGSASALQASDGKSRTPTMGYNSYNDIACSPNSTWMEESIRAMASKGLVELGYDHFQIDCGWQGFDRLANGSITYDASVFPDGIKPLSDLARNMSMKWSMYTDQGVYACDTRQLPEQLRPGSLGHEKQDAAMFAAWNTEYVKVDNCYVDPPANAPKDPRSDFPSRYAAIWDALQSFHIPSMLICQWGTPYINPSGDLEGPSNWAPPISTSYRLSDDIASGWGNVMRIVNEAIHINLKDMNTPQSFADMDLLEVGNAGYTLAEQKSHFSLWALFKSALMISTNVPSMSDETFAILSNKDIIAINQDALGKPVKLIQRFTNNYDIYAGPLANGDLAVILLDTSNSTRTISLNLTAVGVMAADLQDLWTGTTASSATEYVAPVEAHGSIVLRLSNVRPASTRSAKMNVYPASSGTLSGNAKILPCPGCSSGQKVGYISANDSSALIISGIRTSQTSSNVMFSYINCEIGYSFAGKGPNVRGANISVNGSPPIEVLFPLTGYDWARDLLTGFLVRLDGFETEKENEIKITGNRYEPATGSQSNFGLSGWAPDFDSISIVA